jgi:GNAT superfamily N-acetyltransferase
MDFSVGIHYVKNSFIEVRYVVSQDFVNLDSISVSAEFRGCGIGTRFMKQFIEESPLPILVTILYNRPLTFYIGLGFKIESVYCIDDFGNICEAELIYELPTSKET